MATKTAKNETAVEIKKLKGEKIPYYVDVDSTGGNLLPESQPFIIQIENLDSVQKQIKLFGFHWNHRKKNLGIPEFVKVSNLMTLSNEFDGYAALNSYFATNPCKIGKWRFKSDNVMQVRQTVKSIFSDPNGNITTIPFNLSIMKDAYQQQSNIIDVSKTKSMDGRASLEFKLLPKTTLIISMFPAAIFSPMAILNAESDESVLVKFSPPRLSAKNLGPIIINTTNGKIQALDHKKKSKKSTTKSKAVKK